MISRTFVYILALISMVVFEIAQQKHYLDTFDLAAREIGVFELSANVLSEIFVDSPVV